MEMEFEKMPSLATKFKAVQKPEEILFKEKTPAYYQDLENIIKNADNIKIYYDFRVKEIVE